MVCAHYNLGPDLPEQTNLESTQSRILIPTVDNSECFKGRWKHLIITSTQWKNLYLLQNESLQAAMKCGMDLVLSRYLQSL